MSFIGNAIAHMQGQGAGQIRERKEKERKERELAKRIAPPRIDNSRAQAAEVTAAAFNAQKVNEQWGSYVGQSEMQKRVSESKNREKIDIWDGNWASILKNQRKRRTSPIKLKREDS